MDKLCILKFTADPELLILNHWLGIHKHILISEQDLPSVGFTVYNEVGPVAMAFLRKVEGGWGILESLSTNPEADGDVRHHAIDILVEHIFKKAKAIGMKSLVSWTKDASTLKRSKRHGFVQSPHILMARDLTNEEGLCH